MTHITLRIGLVLSLIGIVAFIGTGASSPTALIPTLFGGLLALTGYLGQQRAGLYTSAMYGATTISLVGLLGAGLPLILRGTEASLSAVITQGLMAVLCGVLFVLHAKALFRARSTATPHQL